MMIWRNEEGAALVELLVSIAVVALLAVGATGLTLITIQAETRVSAAAATAQERAVGTALFQRLVSAARPVQEGGKLLFSGTEGTLQMVVRSPFQALPPGDYDAALSVREPAREGEAAVLMMRLSSRGDLGLVVERPLVSGVQSLAYYGTPLGQPGPSWHKVWDHPLAGPDQVMLRLAEGDRFASPVLLIAQGRAS